MQCNVEEYIFAIKSDLSLFQLVKEYSTDTSDAPKEGTCQCQACRCQRCQCQAAKRNCEPGAVSLPIDPWFWYHGWNTSSCVVTRFPYFCARSIWCITNQTLGTTWTTKSLGALWVLMSKPNGPCPLIERLTTQKRKGNKPYPFIFQSAQWVFHIFTCQHLDIIVMRTCAPLRKY